jgi:hypothetical protein
MYDRSTSTCDDIDHNLSIEQLPSPQCDSVTDAMNTLIDIIQRGGGSHNGVLYTLYIII